MTQVEAIKRNQERALSDAKEARRKARLKLADAIGEQKEFVFEFPNMQSYVGYEVGKGVSVAGATEEYHGIIEAQQWEVEKFRSYFNQSVAQLQQVKAAVKAAERGKRK